MASATMHGHMVRAEMDDASIGSLSCDAGHLTCIDERLERCARSCCAGVVDPRRLAGGAADVGSSGLVASFRAQGPTPLGHMRTG